jgi:DNA-binding MarR family transcriptional regulator
MRRSKELDREISMTAGFPSLEDEVYIGLVRTTWLLDAKVHQAYAVGGLSFSQYNILRILRGAREPLSCTDINGRMVSRDPDLTRLLGGLERRGLVERRRSSTDARRVENQISSKGIALMSELDEPVREAIRSQLQALGQEKLNELADLLEEVRQVARKSHSSPR